MGVLADTWIVNEARLGSMITPFARGRSRKGRISYGVSSYGYDFRLANEFRIPDFAGLKLLDPKRINELHFLNVEASSCSIPANSFALGRSLEYFRIPRNILAVCQGKSTYARCGLIVNVTPLEPGWEGYLTISLVNAAPVPIRVYAGEGIGQILFLLGEGDCTSSYADRSGKYQGQKRIQLARI
ncbi:MAG: dCTP deaminase [Acidobacteria bacterium]|nr:dCTP deaminase [Acidobacteriota bacterium]